MIASMTAFGRTEEQGVLGHIIWEIRSVNHRYLEINSRLPDELRMLEASIREHISNKLNRGKVDCVLKYEPGIGNSTDGLTVNQELINAVILSANKIRDSIESSGKINPVEILRWPGVINRETTDPEKIGGPLLEQLDNTLDILVETRRREGEKLKTMILDRCTQVNEILIGLKNNLPVILDGIRERLQTRVSELSIELDKERLEQEIVLLAQKYDIAEELDRLNAHLNEVTRVLENGGPIGRRLDFLMQELNREANTIGSKSAHFDSSNASVNLKVLIEQMREQIQNIE